MRIHLDSDVTRLRLQEPNYNSYIWTVISQQLMASNSVKKMQDKLFGRNYSPLQSDETSLQPATPLTINIPTPETPVRKATGSSPNEDPTEDTSAQAQKADRRPYRERLEEQLGDNYKGAEKHRLREDDERIKHWKRWGPYLSDRQWVRY